MKASYDLVAPFYDLLSKMVYGNAIAHSHQFLAEVIPKGSSILIVGGGTGCILEDITKKYPEGLHITYVDISKKMIARAKRKNTGGNEVVFINRSVHELSLNNLFSVVITPFFLDNFSDNSVQSVFEKLHKLLHPEGLWLFADFEISKTSSLWKKGLLKMMYVFFRFCCNVEATRLPDTEKLFSKYGYALISQRSFFSAFISSKVYGKQ